MKVLPLIVVILASTLSLAAAQTAPAPAPAPSSTSPTPAPATGQIGPGTTGTISPSQGVTPVATDPAHKILNGALTRQTRKTLQQAMNEVTPPTAPAPATTSAAAPATTNTPAPAAGH